MAKAESTRRPTFSVVVEADNVRSAEDRVLRACLDSLGLQEPALGRADGIYLSVGNDGPSEADVEGLRARYPWLRVVPAATATYVGMKAAGANLANSDVVIFCDSDMRYEPGWLDALLAGFAEQPTADVVCGETSTPIRGPYDLAVALTFNFPRFSGETRLTPAPMYWANNVAIRRTLLEATPIPDLPVLHRGQNILHSLELGTRGLTIWRQPNARGRHVVPPASTVIRRYVILGQDAGTLGRLTSHDARAGGQVMAPDRMGVSQLRKFVGRVRQVLRANPLHALMLPLAAPLVGLLVGSYFAGRLSGRPWQASPGHGH